MDFDALFHRNTFVPRLTPILCALCVASFLGLNLMGDNITWEKAKIFGYLPTTSVWTGAPWSLISSTFVHMQLMHILFNVTALWTLGNAFEDEFGSLKWGLFYLGAAWVSSALQLFFGGDTGIGVSGVVYALFGFAWVARRKIRIFAAIMTQQNITIALVWLVGCIVMTQLGLANIGNAAHVSGMAFGAAVAGVFVEKWKRVLSGAGVGALVIASFVPLFWCPLSSEWTGLQAERAQARRDYPTALYWYQRVVERDPDATWAIYKMALIYQQQNDQKNLARTLEKLRSKSSESAGGDDDEKATPEGGGWQIRPQPSGKP